MLSFEIKFNILFVKIYILILNNSFIIHELVNLGLNEFLLSTCLQVDMSRSASSQDDDLLELELTSLQDKRSMPEMSSREEDQTQSTTSEVADLTDNFNKVNPERNVCSVLHRSPSQFKRGV